MRFHGAGALALALFLAGESAQAHESLRLPWVFSDEPDLAADFGFSPCAGGRTKVHLALGGRFAHFGLPRGAARAPKLAFTVEFKAPSDLEGAVSVLRTDVDLADVLKEYALAFSPGQFGSSSKLVYKAELDTEMAPGDYNVRITMLDAGLGIESRRTLHMIVPGIEAGTWQVGDLQCITAVGKRLDSRGREQRVLDPNPWREVGGDLGWDLLVAYNDVGPRPPGQLMRVQRVRRLRGAQEVVWQDQGPAPAKRADQVWLIRVPEAELLKWKGGVYLLEVELKAHGRSATASKTFEVLP